MKYTKKIKTIHKNLYIKLKKILEEKNFIREKNSNWFTNNKIRINIEDLNPSPEEKSYYISSVYRQWKEGWYNPNTSNRKDNFDFVITSQDQADNTFNFLVQGETLYVPCKKEIEQHQQKKIKE